MKKWIKRIAKGGFVLLFVLGSIALAFFLLGFIPAAILGALLGGAVGGERGAALGFVAGVSTLCGVGVVSMSKLRYVRCPRCDDYFTTGFLKSRNPQVVPMPWRRTCVNCGLSITSP